MILPNSEPSICHHIPTNFRLVRIFLECWQPVSYCTRDTALGSIRNSPNGQQFQNQFQFFEYVQELHYCIPSNHLNRECAPQDSQLCFTVRYCQLFSEESYPHLHNMLSPGLSMISPCPMCPHSFLMSCQTPILSSQVFHSQLRSE